MQNTDVSTKPKQVQTEHFQVVRNNTLDKHVWESGSNEPIFIILSDRGESAAAAITLEEAVEVRDALTTLIDNIESLRPKEPTLGDKLRDAGFGAVVRYIGHVEHKVIYVKNNSGEDGRWIRNGGSDTYTSDQFREDDYEILSLGYNLS